MRSPSAWSPRSFNRGLPLVWSAPIQVRFAPGLRRVGPNLLTGPGPGFSVHAASFLRERRMVLDLALKSDPGELRRIYIHELFHWAWLRAGNARRLDFELLVSAEFERRARGELGWSAELKKQSLNQADRASRSRRWREYICESFCDTAAWCFGEFHAHDEFTLAARWARKREKWFLGKTFPI